MALFDRYQPRVRKMIALSTTIVVALLLLALMVFLYTTKKAPAPNESGSKLKNFYTTIMSSGQSDNGAK